MVHVWFICFNVFKYYLHLKTEYRFKDHLIVLMSSVDTSPHNHHNSLRLYKFDCMISNTIYMPYNLKL